MNTYNTTIDKYFKLSSNFQSFENIFCICSHKSQFNKTSNFNRVLKFLIP